MKPVSEERIVDFLTNELGMNDLSDVRLLSCSPSSGHVFALPASYLSLNGGPLSADQERMLSACEFFAGYGVGDGSMDRSPSPDIQENLTMNDVLDKINEEGMDALTEEELEVLRNQ